MRRTPFLPCQVALIGRLDFVGRRQSRNDGEAENCCLVWLTDHRSRLLEPTSALASVFARKQPWSSALA